MSEIKVGVISDADNTLWDTDKVYADAQLWFLSALEEETKTRCSDFDRLAYIRRVDQLLAKSHHSGLKYPPALLANALRMLLAGEPIERAVPEALRSAITGDARLVAGFEEKLRAYPQLRAGVEEGLGRLYSIRIPVVVATESSAERVRGHLKHHSLETLIRSVIAAPKSTDLYIRAAKLMRLSTDQCFVIGDQLDRDIQYGAQAGCKTIYFPGGFSPIWSPKLEQAKPGYVIQSFDEAARLVERAIGIVPSRG